MTVTQAANDRDFEVPERPIGRSKGDSIWLNEIGQDRDKLNCIDLCAISVN